MSDFVEIYADGSFCYASGLCGFAAQIGWAPKQSSILVGQGRAPSSMDAELQALARALGHALQAGWAKATDCVTLYSDCHSALSAILLVVPGATALNEGADVSVVPAKRLGPSMRDSRWLALLVDISTSHSLRIQVRHTYGHGRATGMRDMLLNGRLDRLARHELTLARAEAKRRVAAHG